MQTSKSQALNKLSSFSNKYSSKPAKKEVIKFSDSELEDMSGMSFDEDIMKSLKPATKPAPVKTPPTKTQPPKPGAKTAPKPRSKSPPDISEDSDLGMPNASKFMKKTKQPTFSNALDSEEDSFGKGGNKFLKKKPKKDEIEEKIEKEEEDNSKPGKEELIFSNLILYHM